jgi:hypothetical protein
MGVREKNSEKMIILLLLLQIAKGRKAVKNEELSAGNENSEPEDEDPTLTSLPIIIGLVSLCKSISINGKHNILLVALYLIIKVLPALQRDNSDQWNKKEISLRMLGFESESDRAR